MSPFGNLLESTISSRTGLIFSGLWLVSTLYFCIFNVFRPVFFSMNNVNGTVSL